MRHRKALLFSTLLVFLAPILGSSLAGGTSEHVYRSTGDLWQREADRGYFRVFSINNETAITLYKAPSFESAVVKRLRRGDIVASDGVSRWGGPISWRRISSGLSDGWIPERNLARARPRLLGASTIPAAGSCSGHAPAWTASWTGRLVRISLFPGRAELGITGVLSSQEQHASMLTASTDPMSVDLVLTAEACALVQGQILTGRTGMIIVEEPSGKRLLSGCCEAAPEAFSD